MHFWSARAARHYGLIYRDNTEFANAVKSYGQAILLNPAHARAYLERGILLWRELAQPRRALSDLDVALELRPDWPEALFCRAMAYHDAGDYPAAMQDLTAYLTTGDRAWKDEATKQLNLMHALWDD